MRLAFYFSPNLNSVVFQKSRGVKVKCGAVKYGMCQAPDSGFKEEYFPSALEIK